MITNKFSLHKYSHVKGVILTLLFIFQSCKYDQEKVNSINNINSLQNDKLYIPNIPCCAEEIHDEYDINKFFLKQKNGKFIKELIVNLNDSLLEASFFKNLTTYDSITYLQISNFKSSISIVKFNKFIHLKNLIIKESPITNQKEFFNTFYSIPNLETLFLYESISDKNLSPLIGNLHTLKNLTIIDDSLLKIPNEIGRISGLRYLYLSCNLNQLPDSFANLTEIRQLDLGHNKLTEFPKVILNLKNLIELNLEKNEIIYLPSELIKLKKLKKLGLNYTKLHKVQIQSSIIKSQLKEIEDSLNLKIIYKSFHTLPR